MKRAHERLGKLQRSSRFWHCNICGEAYNEMNAAARCRDSHKNKETKNGTRT